MNPTRLQNEYLLGHEEQELERLMKQAAVLAPMSEHLLQLAGIEPGMHVVDFGCGPGDVSFIASRLVGPRGKVIGIDASADVIALAKRRAKHLGFENVQFLTRDLNQLEPTDPELTSLANAGFDALIGRLVLLYLPDPSGVLKRLVPLLRPGGIVTFQEFEFAGARSEPRVELFELSLQRIQAAFAHKHLDLRLGPKLPGIFVGAGLASPEMRLEGRIETGPEAVVHQAIADVTRTLLPLLIGAEIATADELDLDTLASRLRAEAMAVNATLEYVPLVGAWARVASSHTGAPSD